MRNSLWTKLKKTPPMLDDRGGVCGSIPCKEICLGNVPCSKATLGLHYTEAMSMNTRPSRLQP
jgi:hypothetical protein